MSNPHRTPWPLEQDEQPSPTRFQRLDAWLTTAERFAGRHWVFTVVVVCITIAVGAFVYDALSVGIGPSACVDSAPSNAGLCGPGQRMDQPYPWSGRVCRCKR